MGYRQISGGTFYKFVEPGQVLEGVWEGTRAGKYGDIGAVATMDGELQLFTMNAGLKDLMRVKAGEQVKIEFVNKQKLKNGNEFKAFKVFVDDGAEVDPPEAPDVPHEAEHAQTTPVPTLDKAAALVQATARGTANALAPKLPDPAGPWSLADCEAWATDKLGAPLEQYHGYLVKVYGGLEQIDGAVREDQREFLVGAARSKVSTEAALRMMQAVTAKAAP